MKQQKILKKPKTVDNSEDIMQPEIKFVRIQKKEKYKTIHLKSS